MDAARTGWLETRCFYDAAGNKTETRTGITNTGAGYAARRCTYNRFGKVLLATDALGQTERCIYDKTGLLLSKTDPGGVEKRFACNPRGQRSRFTLLRVGQAAIDLFYEYDEAGRLKTLRRDSAAGPVLAQYSYDANGNRTAKSCPQSGVNTSITCNAAGLPVKLENTRAGQVLSGFTHTYNLDGSQATKTTAGKTISYQYDLPGRLLEENDPQGGCLRYSYDHFGNRARMDVTGAQPHSVVYEYDQNNRLVGETKSEAHAQEMTEYYYDANGNQIYREWYRTGKTGKNAPVGKIGFVTENTSPGRVTMDMREYNGFGQLVWMSRDAVEASYVYRPDGLRHQKTVGKIFEPKSKHSTSLYHWTARTW